MIIHPDKQADLKLRALVLDHLEIAVRNGWMEDAKEIGTFSAKLKAKIAANKYGDKLKSL